MNGSGEKGKWRKQKKIGKKGEAKNFLEKEEADVTWKTVFKQGVRGLPTCIRGGGELWREGKKVVSGMGLFFHWVTAASKKISRHVDSIKSFFHRNRRLPWGTQKETGGKNLLPASGGNRTLKQVTEKRKGPGGVTGRGDVAAEEKRQARWWECVREGKEGRRLRGSENSKAILLPGKGRVEKK